MSYESSASNGLPDAHKTCVVIWWSTAWCYRWRSQNQNPPLRERHGDSRMNERFRNYMFSVTASLCSLKLYSGGFKPVTALIKEFEWQTYVNTTYQKSAFQHVFYCLCGARSAGTNYYLQYICPQINRVFTQVFSHGKRICILRIAGINGIRPLSVGIKEHEGNYLQFNAHKSSLQIEKPYNLK